MRTWSDIYNSWKSYQVHKIEVTDYNPQLHDALYWFHKRKRYMVSYGANAKNDTAKCLAFGRINSTDEIYAAFALYATLREFRHHNSKRSKQLMEVVSDALLTLDGRGATYWHSNSKKVIPYVDSMKLLDSTQNVNEMSWDKYIRNSSEIWNELSEEWVVIRLPEGWA
jgi:hypothetical protein